MDSQSSSKRVARSTSRQRSQEKDADGEPGQGLVTVETSENPDTGPVASRSNPRKITNYFLQKEKNKR